MSGNIPNGYGCVGAFATCASALCTVMFVLVQALVTTGRVELFAGWWDVLILVKEVPALTLGLAIFIVAFCNISGTNIGAKIVLCRVFQAWVAIHDRKEAPIDGIRFWLTLYTMAIGVNFAAFSYSFNLLLATMLWRRILATKQISLPAYRFTFGNFFTCFSASAWAILGVWWRTIYS